MTKPSRRIAKPVSKKQVNLFCFITMKIHLTKSQSQSVAAIINQMSRIADQEVELVFPEESAFFDDPENLTLLKNQGILLRKRVSIVSPNAAHVEAAWSGDVPGYLVMSNTRQKKENFLDDQESVKSEEFTKRYFDLDKRPIEPIEQPAQPELSLQDETDQEAESLFASKDQLQPQKETIDQELKEVVQKDSRKFIIKLSAGAVFLGILGFLYVYLPEASLQLLAVRNRLSFSFVATGSKYASGVDIEKRIIPVQSITIAKELSRSFEVKKKGSSNSKAQGTITVYNQLYSPQVMIPSRFQAENGNIYWSQRNIQIPAKGSLDITLVAGEAGAAYNLTCFVKTPCSFTIPAWKGTDNYTKIFAKSTQPISGGSSGQGYIVGSDEYQQAQTTLRTELLAEAQKELAAKIPQEYTLLNDSVRSELTDISSTPAVGAISSEGKAAVQGKMTLQAFAIREKDLKDLVNSLVKTQLDKDREAKPDSVKVDYTVTSSDTKTGKLTLNVSASEEVAFIINADDLRKQLAGKSETEVRNFLKDLPKVQSAKITLWPFWVRSIPQRLERITIDIQ